MYIIISGAGEVGCRIAESLSRVGHEVTVIEQDPVAIEACKGSLDVNLIHANGAKMEVLKAADIDKADFYFGLSDDDEANMLGCVIAKSNGCTTIARINSLKYISKPVSKKFSSIGVDIAVSPRLVVADKIAKIIMVPALVNRTSMAKGRMLLAETKVNSSAPICRNAILNADLPKGLMIGAVFRGAHVIIPQGKTVIRKGDHLVMVLDSPEKIKEIERFVGTIRRSNNNSNSVMIMGASEMAINLAEKLEKGNVEVKIIDSRRDKCVKAAGRLKKTDVIHGDPMDKRLLLEEGLEKMNAVIPMTTSEEFNILIALLAKIYNTPKVISLLYRTALKSMVETVGIDFAASLKDLTAEAILKEVEQLDILLTVTLHGGELMVFETKVAKRSHATGKQIKNIRLPGGVLIVGIFRKGETLIPNGNDRIMKGDRVITFCFQEMMERVDRMFRG